MEYLLAKSTTKTNLTTKSNKENKFLNIVGEFKPKKGNLLMMLYNVDFRKKIVFIMILLFLLCIVLNFK